MAGDDWVYQHMIEFHDLDPEEQGRLGNIEDAERSHLEEHEEDYYTNENEFDYPRHHKHDVNGNVVDLRPRYAIVFMDVEPGDHGNEVAYALPLKEETNAAYEEALAWLEKNLGRKLTRDSLHDFPSFTVYCNGIEIGGG